MKGHFGRKNNYGKSSNKKFDRRTIPGGKQKCDTKQGKRCVPKKTKCFFSESTRCVHCNRPLGKAAGRN